MAQDTDSSSFADWVDALRLREGPAPSTPGGALPASVASGLERCAQDYERQGAQRIDRRRHVGALVFGATAEQQQSIAAYFGSRLGLRIVEIDARAMRDLSDEDASARLATLSEPTGHLVMVRGLGPDADPRTIEAIEWSDVDVLVVACAEHGAFFSPAIRRHCKHRIDAPSAAA